LQLSSKTIGKIRIFFVATFTALSGWYLYWYASDVFIWHKSILNINMTNLYGTIVSVALILLAAKLKSVTNFPSARMQSKKLQETIQINSAKPIEIQNEPTPKLTYTSTHHHVSIKEQLETDNIHDTPTQISTSFMTEKPKQTTNKHARSNKNQVQPRNDPNECAHFLGYLCEPDKSKEIPEQCLTCKNLIDCLRKTD
jgi:hypothetical protein